MRTFFISRHQGAIEWATQQGLITDNVIIKPSFDASEAKFGDQVIGTLPVQIVASICRQGARYFHLTLDVPEQWRGQEMTVAQMSECNARIEEYVITSGYNVTGTKDHYMQPDEHIQVCVVSAYTEPSYIPIAQFKPKKVLLLETERFKKASKLLASQIRSLGISCERRALPDLDDLAAFREFAFELANALRRQYDRDISLVFNATGGKKNMSMMLNQAFSSVDNSYVMYFEGDTGDIQTLYPNLTTSIPVQKDIITLDVALALKGYKLSTTESSNHQDWVLRVAKRRELSEWMVEHLDDHKLVNQISLFNKQVAQTNINLKQPLGNQLHNRFNDFQFSDAYIDSTTGKFIEQLEAQGLINLVQDSKRQFQLSFKDVDAAKFLSGFWLEEYCWHKLRDVFGDDCAHGVSINDVDTGKVLNEFDLLVTKNNRLVFVECKTSVMKSDSGVTLGGRTSNSDIYKLEALRSALGGDFATSLMVSMKDLPVDSRLRAAKGNVIVLTGNKIMHIAEVVSMWLETRNITKVQDWIDNHAGV